MAVRERGQGRWQVELYGTKDPRTGKYRRYAWTVDATTKTADFPEGVRTRADADRFDVIQRSKLDGLAARFVVPSRETLSSYLSRWLEERTQPNTEAPLRPTSAKSYGEMIRCHIVPALGNVALDALSPAMVKAWLGDMAAGRGAEVKVKDGKVEPKPVSPRTASYARTVLRIALQDAVNLGALAQNVVDRVKAPKQSPRNVEAFTLEEAQRVFEEADATRYGPLVRFMMFAGLRRGEALGLKWGDLDEKAGTVTIRREVVALGGVGVVQDYAKTRAGLRTVPLPDPAMDALRAQRKAQVDDKKRALKTGTPYRDEGWVFATADGGTLNPKNASRDFRRIRGKAGAPDLPLHATRHTAVTLLLAAGVDLATVSKIIGHKRYAFTVDRYGHLSPEAAQAATDAMNRFLAGRVRPAAGKPAKRAK